MVGARRAGACRALGLSLSGPTAARTLTLALEARVDGERVFDAVQATVNLLEPSVLPLLAAAHDAGLGVIAKEVHANGRLTDVNPRSEDAAVLASLRRLAAGVRHRDGAAATVADLALAFVLAEPCIDVALSGAATTAQLTTHVAALDLELDGATRAEVTALAEPTAAYWATRAGLPWS